MFGKRNKNSKPINYYFNPEKFKFYENNTIGFGGFIVFIIGDMFVMNYAYVKEIIRSSHIPWSLDDLLGDTLRKHYLEHDIVSLTPYDGIQIIVNDKESQLIKINDHTIKVDYSSNYRNLNHKLLLKNKVVKESKSLKELWEIAVNE